MFDKIQQTSRENAERMFNLNKQVADWHMDQAKAWEKPYDNGMDAMRSNMELARTTARSGMELAFNTTQTLGKAWLEAAFPANA